MSKDKSVSGLSKTERKKGSQGSAKLVVEPTELDAKTAESMLSMLRGDEPTTEVDLDIEEGVQDSLPDSSEEDLPDLDIPDEVVEESSLQNKEAPSEPVQVVQSEKKDPVESLAVLIQLYDWIHFCDVYNEKVCNKTYSKVDCFSCKHHSYCKLRASLLSQLGI